MNKSFRTGIGFDIHRLVEGRPLVLGGVEIPFEKGLLGHSDSDVLAHAICDALLGAAALGDIGTHFPDTDAQYAGASSMVLLARVAALVRDLGYSILNVDSMVLAERPKLAPYIHAIRDRLAQELDLDRTAVSVKAKTMEGLGDIGEGRAMAAQAVVQLGPSGRSSAYEISGTL